MTTRPAAAGQPGRNDLTERIFQALYEEFRPALHQRHLRRRPQRHPWFAGTSLGHIARQISDHDHPGPAASPAGQGHGKVVKWGCELLFHSSG